MIKNMWDLGILGILGLGFGSFCNVLIWRLNDSKAPRFWQGRSLCPNCRHFLSWQDNVPLLSFVILRGKCRYCRKPISWQYPAVELTTAIFFVITGLHPVALVIGSAFIVIFFSDLIYGFVPDLAVATIIFLSILGRLGNLGNLFAATATGILSALFFLLIRLVANFLTRKEALGTGDITLALAIGVTLGWPRIAVAIWSGFIVGGVIALGLILLKKTKLSATIPLGPFLIVGAIIAVLFSDKIFQFLGFG